MFTWGCAASVDVASMFRDFDDYEKDLRAVTTDPQAIEMLDAGKAKRADAEATLEIVQTFHRPAADRVTTSDIALRYTAAEGYGAED